MALERVVLTVLTRAALALLMLLRKRDEKREGGAGGVAGVATDDGGGAAKISFGGYSTERVYAMLRHGRGASPSRRAFFRLRKKFAWGSAPPCSQETATAPATAAPEMLSG